MTYRFDSLVSRAALACTLLSLPLLAGCPGDDGTAESSGSSGTAASSGTAEPPGTTTVDPTGGDSTAATSSMGSTSDSGGSSGGSSGDTTAGGTGPGVGCGDLDARMCNSDPMCMPIGGAPIQMPDGMACLGPREFLECQPTMGCGDAITFACESEGSTPYQFQDTCVPTGWVPCDPPPIDLSPC